MRVELFRLPMAGPDDVSGLAALLTEGRVRGDQVAAVIAQTEGDGYARGFTRYVLEELLGAHTGWSREEVGRRIPLLIIGNANIAPPAPHLNVLVRDLAATGGGPAKRLVLGTRVGRDLLPEELGTLAQVQDVAAQVRAAVQEAGIAATEDVHCVYVKAPELTPERIRAADARGRQTRTRDLRVSGALSRGAAALGVALALGEVPAARLSDDAIGADWELYSRVAHASSGAEQTACKVVVLGNAGGSASDLVAGHGIMWDTLDVDGFKAALRSVGLVFDCCPSPEQLARVDNVFINAGANASGELRGRRHAMHTDFLWPYAGAQAKAIANAVVASVMGDTMYLTCAGPEHQGPRGANLVAVFARPPGSGDAG